ncbi:hypothetical protein IWQ60_010369 [Tieghemiomyces parasiticus]|uniref:NADP-dependent oxidoreductase domain-containing protein n=1 Tax=Tieghemiomyces parasiticus TaxID=78921 RepID=A0A9W7ZQQ9_9FUNG|nr:hypothetical protein IWQ60_010369 [Tieghemiomyces parasiticus]
MVHQREVKLANGTGIPAIGLGTWQAEPGELTEVIQEAWAAGYHHIDAAHYYQNEREIGTALRMTEVPRDQIWLTSKVWNTDHRPERVGPACDQTLSDLQVEYLDLYLMHWPIAFVPGDDLLPRDNKGEIKVDDVDYKDTWRAMEKLVDEGKVRYIGVSNFTIKQLEDLLKVARIKPVVNQVECNVYLPQYELVEYCQKHGIAVTAYRPLAGRVKVGDEKPSSGHKALREDPVLTKIAQRINRTPAQVAIAWLLKRGIIAIPKSSNPQRLRENLIDFDLTDEDAAEISKIGVRQRDCNPANMWSPSLDYLTKSDEGTK